MGVSWFGVFGLSSVDLWVKSSAGSRGIQQGKIEILLAAIPGFNRQFRQPIPGPSQGGNPLFAIRPRDQLNRASVRAYLARLE